MTLTSIEVTPGGASLSLGLTQQMAAKGKWSDGTEADVTTSASWSTSDAAIAVVDSAGFVTSLAEGQVQIHAERDGVVGSAAFNVDPAALTHIDLVPPTVELPTDVSVQCGAQGIYTDGSVRDVTREVVWQSLDPLVASVSNAPGSEGLATSLAPGVARIQAQSGALLGTGELTVHPIHVLEAGAEQAPSSAVTATSADGTALAAWCHQFASAPGELWWARYEPASGWGPKQRFDTGTVVDRTFALALAANDAGDALLAWTGHDGLYAASYAPGAGWGAITVLASGPNPFLDFAEGLQLAMDPSGNGLLVWKEPNGPIRSRRYLAGVGWQATQTVGSPAFAAQMGNLDMASDGSAWLLWQHWNLGPWTLNASEFTPAGGWAAPVPLQQSAFAHHPVVDLADDGTALAVWLLEEPPIRVRFAWRPAGSGWQPPGTFTETAVTGWPSVALDPLGDALVCWVGANALGYTVSAKRYLEPAGWQGEEVLRQFTINAPQILPPFLSGGDGAAFWLNFGVATWLERRPLRAASGWGEVEPLSFMAYGVSATSDIRTRFHPVTGVGFVSWLRASAEDVEDVLVHRHSILE